MVSKGEESGSVTAKVFLKKSRDKNVRMRHPWVFSGAIQNVEGKAAPGETVEVRAANGDLLGMGAYSPESQIRVRMWSVGKALIDKDFFTAKIAAALQQREQLGIPQRNTGYRVINAESDGLPGVVVDRYNDWLVMQCLTAGAEYWKQTVADILLERTVCQGVYERSDVSVRKKEGLSETTGLLAGEMPPETVDIVEEKRFFWVDVLKGHKTGFYLDQRDNRSILAAESKDKTVLNCFSYSGGFGIAALQGEAQHVTNIDSSQSALNLGQRALALNEFAADKVEDVCGDVFQLLRKYRDEGRQFDIVVLDPPKFAENRNQLNKAARGYKDINLLGFKLLKPGGLLFTFSCSGLMDGALFQKVVSDAAVDAGCDAQIIRKLDQAQDHPTRLGFPEGYYLKGLVCRK